MKVTVDAKQYLKMRLKAGVLNEKDIEDVLDQIYLQTKPKQEYQLELPIKIKKSSKADTRTCNVSEVSIGELAGYSTVHIQDVYRGMQFFKSLLEDAALIHDFTKLSHLDQFYSDFQTKFETQFWYNYHKKTERHHILVPEGVRDDVNLVDVIECIVDCVMAGVGRSGRVSPINISPETLQKAFENTVALLAKNVELDE